MHNTEATTNSLRIGDTVTGVYYGVPFTGIISGGHRGGLDLDIVGRFEYLGTVRDGLWLFADQVEACGLQVVRASDVTWDDVFHVEGTQCLRKAASARIAGSL